ncbi:MAG: hypothetical protein DMF69_17080, partial [Acidobacteria bacterium]
MNNRIYSTSVIAKYLAAVVILLTVLVNAAQAATLTVVNTNDSGAGQPDGDQQHHLQQLSPHQRR